MTDKQRANPFDKVRSHAIEAARAGQGVMACPCPRPSSYQSAWLRAYFAAAQREFGFDDENGHIPTSSVTR